MRRISRARQVAIRTIAPALLLSTAVGAITASSIAPAFAQASVSYAVPAGSLADALASFGRQSGLQVTYIPEIARGKRSPGVSGPSSADDALATILSESGLVYGFASATTVSITEPAAPGMATIGAVDGAIELDAVTLSGAGAGNATTEGNGRYSSGFATIGKIEQPLRQVPQSVTVVSRQQMDDQDLRSLNEVLAATNGATVVRQDEANERTEIYLRGFRLDTIKVDGLSMSGNNDVTTFDSAIYDRIEVLRGPAGILQSGGEPAGAVNLVRKQATDTFRASAEASIGSWSGRRAEVDVSGPLVKSGAVRGRFVAATDNGDSFIDLVNSEKALGFGTLAIDLSESTTLTLGGAYQKGESRGSRGLPAYADGTLLDVPRSTFIGPDWAHSDTRSTDVFANLEHRFDNDAVLNLSGNFLDRKRDGKLGFSDTAVDPETGFTELLPEHRIDAEKNTNFDANIVLPVEIGGLTQTFMLGAEHHRNEEKMDRAREDGIPQNVFDPIHDLEEPDFVINERETIETRQTGLYGQAQIKPISWGTIVVGGRFSWWESDTEDRILQEQIAENSISGEFSPSIAVIADLSDNISAYASYASIFVPQEELTVDSVALEPREGDQYEVGLKGDFMDGLLQGRLALFTIEDTNRAIADPTDDDFAIAAGKVRSRGFEAEIGGEIMPSWQLMAGYSYVETEYLDDPELAGEIFEPQTPKHSARVWTKYTVDHGMLEGLSVGGGVSAFSEAYVQEGDVRFDQAGFATADLQLGYTFNEHLRAALTVTNVLDKKYYRSVGGSERQNYYGEPQAVSFKLSANW